MVWQNKVYCFDLENDIDTVYTDFLSVGGRESGMNRVGKLFLISGPSGVGKTVLLNYLISRLGSKYNLHRVITYTTKAPRAGEVAGQDYHYLSSEEFQAKLGKNFFLEYSLAYDNYYGSPRSILSELNLGKSFLLVVDQVGAYSIQQSYAQAVLIWVLPPSLVELRDRLQKRRTESPHQVERRLSIAAAEIEVEAVNKRFDYHVINGDLKATQATLEQIISHEMDVEVGNC